jgi:Flp pilus assembly protein TadD
VLLAGGAAAVVASVLLVPPWLAARDVDAALRGWHGNPAAAFNRLDRARQLNPLSDEADVLAGVIAGQVGDTVRERAAFERALRRNPDNWYPYMELGVLDARAGRRASALRRLERARALNPLERVLIVVQDWLRDGDTPTRKDLDRLLLSRAAHLQPGAH